MLKFLEIFGIPILINDKEPLNLTDFLLEKSSGQLSEDHDELSLSEDDIKIFLAEISRRSVQLSPQASNLLQKYFVTCRQIRPRFLSQKAFKTLLQFSESFAKLSFRHLVLESDIIGAIFIAENSLNKLFRADMYPSPKFQLNDNYIGSVDLYFKTFQNWLEEYLNIF